MADWAGIGLGISTSSRATTMISQHEAASPHPDQGALAGARLSLDPAMSPDAGIHGGWWPRSRDAAAELPALLIPPMRKQGGGRIINMSSIGGKFYEPLGSWYHASKFAVEGLSDSPRLELRPFGIDVVLIETATILSEWNQIARQSCRTPQPARL
jgi:NAD(P)-dependent dehydrogenase (short-subunit alcohol dehydrogenase family)